MQCVWTSCQAFWWRWWWETLSLGASTLRGVDRGGAANGGGPRSGGVNGLRRRWVGGVGGICGVDGGRGWRSLERPLGCTRWMGVGVLLQRAWRGCWADWGSQEVWRSFDVNGDGVLSFDEFKLMMLWCFQSWTRVTCKPRFFLHKIEEYIHLFFAKLVSLMRQHCHNDNQQHYLFLTMTVILKGTIVFWAIGPKN